MIKYFFVCILFFSTACFAYDGKPHLILHFDVNMTLIAFDSVGGDTTEDVLKASHLSEEKIQEMREKIDTWPVFKSFFTLVSYLREEGYSFTVFLRSFGTDLSFTSEQINSVLDEPFFEKWGAFQQEVFLVDNQSLSDHQSIYDYLATSSNLVILDDYSWWKSHRKNPAYGKPLCIDSTSSEVQFFFDDHHNIVAQIDAKSGEKIVDLPENTHVIQVDTYQAILDDDYFVKHIINLVRRARDRPTGTKRFQNGPETDLFNTPTIPSIGIGRD